jgi:hypothetical protein
LTVEHQLSFADAVHPTTTSSRVAVAVDLLRGICTAEFEPGDDARSAIVQNSALRAVPLADILRAFHVLSFSGNARIVSAHRVAGCALEEYATPREIVAAILEVQDEIPQYIADLVGACLGGNSSLHTLVPTTCLFGLRTDVFNELALAVSQNEYHRKCVDQVRTALSVAQYELAWVLSSDWQGSLDSLCATVRILCPVEGP